ncbi:MAG: hypothetical protein ACRYG4_00945 [Janthinobacterium lividum]
MIPHVASSTSTATAAIRLASARQGIDFNYLLNQAKTESGLDPEAAAPTSSARGLFQFTAGTWLETIRRHGREHGLGKAAAALDGAVDPATRAAILDLRRDPFASADMAASYAADNAAKLSTGLGRTATATDLYLAHFLGAAGALRFLKAEPSTPASATNPATARANPRIFFAADGSPRSVEQVHDHFAAIFGGKPVPATGTALPVPRQPALQIAAAPDAARMAYLLLAELSA